MAKKTPFEKLGQVFLYGNKNIEQETKINKYTLNSDDVIFKTKDPQEFETKKRQIAQSNYLANQWYGSNKNMTKSTGMVSNNVKLMYRDCDLMDGFPEIGTALDIFAEESCSHLILTSFQSEKSWHSVKLKLSLDHPFERRE